MSVAVWILLLERSERIEVWDASETSKGDDCGARERERNERAAGLSWARAWRDGAGVERKRSECWEVLRRRAKRAREALSASEASASRGRKSRAGASDAGARRFEDVAGERSERQEV